MEQAHRDWSVQVDLGASQLSGANMTAIVPGAQIYLFPIDPIVSGAPELIDPYSDLAHRMQTSDAASWGYPGYDVALNGADPNPPPGLNVQLTRGENDTVHVGYYQVENGIPAGLLMVLAAPFAAALLGPALGAAEGAVEGAAWTSGYDLAMGSDLLSMTGVQAATAASVAESASSAGGWTSGYDLPMGGDLLSTTGAGAAPTVAADEFANETAKLLQQQALSDGGVNLLSTSLPTIDLSNGAWSFSDLLPSGVSPSSVQTAISTARSALGIATGVRALTSRTATRTGSGAGLTVLPGYDPTYGTPLPPQDNSKLFMTLGVLGAGALVLVLLSRGKK